MNQEEQQQKDTLKRYKDVIENLKTNRSEWEAYASQCEDFYYSDVEGTHSQFTKKDKDRIKNDYDIQLSINICQPVIQQTIAFLIGNKPSVRIMPVGAGDKNVAYKLQEIWSGLWYKSKCAQKTRDVLTDVLTAGSGYYFVEPSNFYENNIFNVNITYLPWRYVYYDINCIRQDLSDSEFILVAKQISIDKFNNIYANNGDSSITEDPFSALSAQTYTEISSKSVIVNDLYTKKYTRGGFLSRDGKITDEPVHGSVQIKEGVYIYRVIMEGYKRIIWEGWLPSKEYPIIHVATSFRPSSPTGNKTYPIIHYIMDCQSAINKIIAQLILNAQTHGNTKMLVPESAELDEQQIYDWAADPRRPLIYKVDPNEVTIKPERLMPAPLSQGHYTLYHEIIKMVEYITGIYSVMQGNPTDAPNTFGGTQSLQVYGTQRIKMTAGIIDEALSKVCQVAISYILFYAKPGNIYRYVNDNPSTEIDPRTGQTIQYNEAWREVQLEKIPDINEYDIVAMPHPSTPTTRMLASQLLGIIAGQTRDSSVANLLTQYSLRLMDIPEADEVIQKVDIIQQLQVELQKTQESIKQLQIQTQLAQKENQGLQKEIINLEAQKEVDKRTIQAMHELDKTDLTIKTERVLDILDKDIKPKNKTTII